MTGLAERLRPSTSVKDWVPGSPTVPAPYIRPADWVALPAVTSSDQKFVGLHAVYNHDSNFVAVNCAGAYTVDWGDGTAAENIATGVQANHNYVYSALGSGTLSSRGYRQAIVTIMPQGGSNLTKVDLFIQHNQSGLTTGYTTGWLDIRMAGSLVTTLTISGAAGTVLHRMLEQFEFLGTNGVTTFVNKFLNCTALRAVALYTGVSGDFTSMFSGCSSLTTIPLLVTANTNTFASMFLGCIALQTIPLLNTGAGLFFDSMFSGCLNLTTVPLLNTASGTNFTSMFLNCSALTAIPLLNTASGTNFTSMFSGCRLLTTVPLFNTASGTNFTSMFQSCSVLQSVPLLNTASGTNFSSMFSGCPTLRTIPLLNTGAATTVNGMFSSCSALQSIPLLDTAVCATFTSMFNACRALTTVPALNMASGTTLTTMFTTCPSLRSVSAIGTIRDIDYSSCSLGPTALDAIYSGLAAMNLLSANAASCETNVTDWSTGPVNCAVSQSTVTGGSGTKAARLTSSAAGTTSASITSRIAISASSPYTFLATVKSSVARSANVAVAWYDGGGSLISTDTGASVTSSTSVWTQLTVSATSPVGAATASVILVAVATAGAETHDFDKMGLFYGLAVTLWLAGGQTTPVITVTSNWGTTSDTPSIATNKGWTVTGS